MWLDGPSLRHRSRIVGMLSGCGFLYQGAVFLRIYREFGDGR